jgi:hypothetical protein
MKRTNYAVFSDQLESMIPNMDMQEFEILTPMEVVEVTIKSNRYFATITSFSEKI